MASSWAVRFERQHTGIAVWILVFGFFALQVQVWEGPPPGPEFVLTEGNRCVEMAARTAVNRSLAVIGHGVKVSEVEVKPIQKHAAAQYSDGSNSVTFSNEYFPSSDQLLHTAAHESVHAIFDQAHLTRWSEDPVWESWLVVEEVAAEVLGAHIAGRVMALRGGDGEALTRRLVREFRIDCDLSASGGWRRLIWILATRVEPERKVPDLLYMTATHHGPVEMVDEIDRICREHFDPWEAAHVIADRFIEPIDG